MLKLHHAPNSRAGRIVWLLEELGLPYELNRMDFHPKDLKSDEHRARHPLGRVPVLEDGEAVIHDSTRILRYLVRTYGGGKLLPDDSRSRGLVWVIEEYADEGFAPLLRRATLGVDEAGQRLTPAGRTALRSELAHHYEALEQVLGNDDFFVGNRATLADIALYGLLSRVELYSPRGIPSEYAKIRAWYGRMKE